MFGNWGRILFECDIMELMDGKAEIAERTARFLKAELKRADITYEELARRLTHQGLHETRDSVAAKLKRGTFTAAFFIACLRALDIETLTLAELSIRL
jgi:hypothetical protein